MSDEMKKGREVVEEMLLRSNREGTESLNAAAMLARAEGRSDVSNLMQRLADASSLMSNPDTAPLGMSRFLSAVTSIPEQVFIDVLRAGIEDEQTDYVVVPVRVNKEAALDIIEKLGSDLGRFGRFGICLFADDDCGSNPDAS